MKNLLLIGFTTLFLSGCLESKESVSIKQEIKSPSETFLEYYENSKTNLDFEIEASFYSEAMNKEVREKMPEYVERMKLDSVDAAKSRYMKFSAHTAKCMGLELVKESVVENTAELEYTVFDLCTEVPEGETPNTARQVVIMKNENGWKIDSKKLFL